jgi:hypothetical protein
VSSLNARPAAERAGPLRGSMQLASLGLSEQGGRSIERNSPHELSSR